METFISSFKTVDLFVSYSHTHTHTVHTQLQLSDAVEQKNKNSLIKRCLRIPDN